MEFKTAILPYLEIGIGSSMLGAGGGVEGEIAMIADPKLGLHVGLHGQDGDFWGDVGIGVKFAPKMTLSITPYLAAHAGPAEARWDIATYQGAQMELFNFEWQDSLTFGDRDEKGPIAALQDKPSKATKAEKPKADAPDEDRQSSVKVGDKDVSGKDVQGDTGRAGIPFKGNDRLQEFLSGNQYLGGN